MTTLLLVTIGVGLLVMGWAKTRELAVTGKLNGAFLAWLGVTVMFGGGYSAIDQPSAFLDERAIDDSDRVAIVVARVRAVEDASVVAALDAMAAAHLVDAIWQVSAWPWFDEKHCESADFKADLREVILTSGWSISVTCVLVSGPKMTTTGGIISPGLSKPKIRFTSPWGRSLDRFSDELHASALHALYLPTADAGRQHLAEFIGKRSRDLEEQLAQLQANIAGGAIERTWLDYLQYSAAISTTIGNTYLVPSTAWARALTILHSFISVFLFGYAFQALLLRDSKS